MSEEELTRLLALLIERGDISQAEAADVLSRYQAGEIRADDLPATIEELTGETRADELAEILLFLLLLLRQVDQPDPLRDQIRDEAEAAIRDAGERHPPGSYAWSLAIRAILQRYTYGEITAGGGDLPGRDGVAAGERSLSGLLQWLYLFAGAAAARRLLGRPYSPAYIQNRTRQYLAQAWAEYHRQKESRPEYQEAGWVIDYIAEDDPATCSPCSDAAASGPYLPGSGPYPGEICDGGGNCRCTRVARWDPAEAARLRSIA